MQGHDLASEQMAHEARTPRKESREMDPGPISLVYYSACAVPGAAAGLLAGLSSRRGAGATLVATGIGALGGIGGGSLVATLPTGTGSGDLILVGLLLFTALCGWLSAFVAIRLLRWSGS